MSSEKLTATGYTVLSLVNLAEEVTPYDLKQMVDAWIGSFWPIPHSQIYSESERMAKAGYLSERREKGGRRRKYYSLTSKGRKTLDEWLSTPTAALFQLRDAALLQLLAGADPKVLAPVQLEAHRERLQELEQMHAQLRLAGAPSNQLLVVEAGIGHQREYVRFWEKLAG